MTDRFVTCLDVVTSYGLGALQVLVVGVVIELCLHFVFRLREYQRRASEAPDRATIPVGRPTVIAVVFDFVLTGNGFVRLDRGTVLDLLHWQFEVQGLIELVPLPKRMGGEQYEPARQPRACICDQIANRPGFVVKVEILHMADCAIQSGEFVAVEIFCVL